MEVRRYLAIFKQAAINRFAVYAVSRLDFATFIFGKLLRMGFFVLLAVSLFNHTDQIAGYGEAEVLLFFAIMNMVDILTQVIWYRGMYSLKDWIRRGKFDAFLIQPVSPLFKTVGMQLDLFDVIILPVGIIYVCVIWSMLPVRPDLVASLLGLLLFLLSMVLAFSINLCITATAFWTTENEGAWSIYRDAIYVARFPGEVFPEGLRLFLTFVIPVLAIVSFPTKALLGLLTPQLVLAAFILVFGWFTLGMYLWRAGLRHYTSASG